jgi:hypothetical protein
MRLVIGGVDIAKGTQTTIDLPLPQLYTHTDMLMPVHVIRGRRDGPTLFVCAALHGDEINGVEIIRRLIHRPALKRLRGTLIAVPIVNTHGFINQSRYLPDRRDLNRVFPGSERGSLAARVAYQFMQEIVSKCTHGIDLHTAATHRENLPQIRADLSRPGNAAMAHAFGAPVILDAALREGSIREAVQQHDIDMIVYEAGEALRFNELAIRAGLRGILSVMHEIGMLASKRRHKIEPTVARSYSWVRASQSGIMRLRVPLGARVSKNQVIGAIADPFGHNEEEIIAHATGIVIGRTNLPLVNEGEAIVHIARFADTDSAEEAWENFQAEMDPDEPSPPPESD